MSVPTGKTILAMASWSHDRASFATWNTLPFGIVRAQLPTTAKVAPVVTEPLNTFSPFGLGTTSPCMCKGISIHLCRSYQAGVPDDSYDGFA